MSPLEAMGDVAVDFAQDRVSRQLLLTYEQFTVINDTLRTQLQQIIDATGNAEQQLELEEQIWLSVGELKPVNRSCWLLLEDHKQIVSQHKARVDEKQLVYVAMQYELAHINQQYQQTKDFTTQYPHVLRDMFTEDEYQLYLQRQANDSNSIKQQQATTDSTSQHEHRLLLLAAELEQREIDVQELRSLQQQHDKQLEALRATQAEVVTFEQQLAQLYTQSQAVAQLILTKEELQLMTPTTAEAMNTRESVDQLPLPLYTLYHQAQAHKANTSTAATASSFDVSISDANQSQEQQQQQQQFDALQTHALQLRLSLQLNATTQIVMLIAFHAALQCVSCVFEVTDSAHPRQQQEQQLLCNLYNKTDTGTSAPFSIAKLLAASTAAATATTISASASDAAAAAAMQQQNDILQMQASLLLQPQQQQLQQQPQRFAYLWLQRLCNINTHTTSSNGLAIANSSTDSIGEAVEKVEIADVMQRIARRYAVRLSLSQQTALLQSATPLSASAVHKQLEKGVIDACGSDAALKQQNTAASVTTTLTEFCSFACEAGKNDLNQQQFTATFQHQQHRVMHAHITVHSHYPSKTPVFTFTIGDSHTAATAAVAAEAALVNSDIQQLQQQINTMASTTTSGASQHYKATLLTRQILAASALIDKAASSAAAAAAAAVAETEGSTDAMATDDA